MTPPRIYVTPAEYDAASHSFGAWSALHPRAAAMSGLVARMVVGEPPAPSLLTEAQRDALERYASHKDRAADVELCYLLFDDMGVVSAERRFARWLLAADARRRTPDDGGR